MTNALHGPDLTTLMAEQASRSFERERLSAQSLELALRGLREANERAEIAAASFRSLAAEVEEWQVLAARAKTAKSETERLLAASLLVERLLTPPKEPCGTCDGLDAKCPDCREVES